MEFGVDISNGRGINWHGYRTYSDDYQAAIDDAFDHCWETAIRSMTHNGWEPNTDPSENDPSFTDDKEITFTKPDTKELFQAQPQVPRGAVDQTPPGSCLARPGLPRPLTMKKPSPIQYRNHTPELSDGFYHPDCPVLYAIHDRITSLADCPFLLKGETYEVKLFGVSKNPDVTKYGRDPKFAVVEFIKRCGHLVLERIPFFGERGDLQSLRHHLRGRQLLHRPRCRSDRILPKSSWRARCAPWPIISSGSTSRGFLIEAPSEPSSTSKTCSNIISSTGGNTSAPTDAAKLSKATPITKPTLNQSQHIKLTLLLLSKRPKRPALSHPGREVWPGQFFPKIRRAGGPLIQLTGRGHVDFPLPHKHTDPIWIKLEGYGVPIPYDLHEIKLFPQQPHTSLEMKYPIKEYLDGKHDEDLNLAIAELDGYRDISKREGKG